jgi:energy-coupling factor transporter ATP-binding protein EcfA2
VSRALRFRQLQVRRMPGFPGGGLQLDELSPGINLVHGPNASGKTTAAVALQSLLWPASAPPTARVEGLFDLDGAEWRAEVDARRPSWQRDGQPASAPPLPPRDTRDRYLLSLHSLLVADDGELAARIQVETAGGYDVDAAAASLAFKSAGPPRTLVAALRDERASLADAREREAELREEASELERLRARLAEVASAAGRQEVLERAIALVHARSAAAEAERALAFFPEGVARLRGDEAERLAEWRAARADAEAALAEARTREADASRELERLGLGEEGIAPALLDALVAKVDAVRRADGELARAREDRAAAVARRARCGELLGIDPAWGGEVPVSATDANRLDGLIHRAEDLRARRAALEARLRGAGAPAEAGSDGEGGAGTEARSEAEAAAAEEAARVLRSWLRTPDGGGAGEGRLRALVVAAIVVLGAAGVLATVLGPAPVQLLGAGLIVVAGVLLALRPARSTGRSEAEREAERLGHAPAAWTADAVEARLAALERAVAAARLAGQRREDARLARADLAALEVEEAALSAERAALASETGLGEAAGELALHQAATRLREWDEARAAEAVAEARIAVMEAERGQALSAAWSLLSPYASGPEGVPESAAFDADSLAAGVQALRLRREAHERWRSERDRARSAAESAGSQLAELDARRAALLERLGLSPDDEHRVREWAAQLDAYAEARSAAAAAGRDAESAARALAESGGKALEGATPAELEAGRAAAVAAASEERSLRDRIVEIETDLNRARQKHDVEEALARVAEAESALAAQRDTDAEAEVGVALVAWLREQVSDRNRPRVFHRARAIFADITRGRYRLDLDERDGQAFRAYDTTTHHGHALDELSSGTRVQLLLAVRMAFVETQEAGVALPLLLDEVLANSDDERAAAIIDAAVSLARAGRQLFYFTAQADELVKWKARLEAQDQVEWCVRGMLDGRGGEGAAMDWTPAERPVIPSPAGLDHAAYGRLLGVPPFDPWADGVGGVHLWYLIGDVESLHTILAMGIERWGQLDFLTASGLKVSDALRDVVEEARRAAHLCDRFRLLWRQGRGRPVNRGVLDASGAVSEAFLDPVSEVCDEVSGDAAALLQALEDRQVARFRTAQIDALRDFFLANGYLSDEDAMPADWIRLTLTTEAAARRPALPAGAVEELLARLVRGPGVPV